ncbi:DUF4397 domain-containing protein [Woeseia oceani]|uniref:DUF4397 domain-containing protein n=1 Tax=Woeseia oceani TaxID=1548547 RepID=A0A193LJ56_9GAMM|nr:DUF4397 domain-containing protein [Woeseia oceani]ANO52565.1 hypothetical protein BA177_16455 [Woeseia oceani]
MSNFLRIAIPLFLFALAGCSSGSSTDSGNTATPLPPAVQGNASVQILHASPDAPAVNIRVSSTEINGVDYKTGTGILTLPNNVYTVQIDGILPDGATTVIGPVQLPFAANTRYSVLAIGDVANIMPLVLEQPDTAVPAGSTRLRVVHGAPLAGPVDVYLTPPGADLSASAPVGTFDFGGDLGPVDVTAGDYQVRVTVAGDPTALAFDSGTIALTDGANLLITAVENTLTGPAPVSLVLQDGTGSSELLDVRTSADVRVVHASPDAPDVDVVVNDDFANPLVPALAFPEFTPFVSVPPATYNIKVTDAATQSVIAINVDLELMAGLRYNVLAVDNLVSIAPLLAIDDPRPVATESKVRIIHASPAAGDVDIYVTAPQTDINTVDPTLSDIPFQANTGFLSLVPGDYEVTVTAAGSKTAAIGPAAISIAGGGVYTAIARDAAGGGAPLGLILMDDFVAP